MRNKRREEKTQWIAVRERIEWKKRRKIHRTNCVRCAHHEPCSKKLLWTLVSWRLLELPLASTLDSLIERGRKDLLHFVSLPLSQPLSLSPHRSSRRRRLLSLAEEKKLSLSHSLLPTQLFTLHSVLALCISQVYEYRCSYCKCSKKEQKKRKEELFLPRESLDLCRGCFFTANFTLTHSCQLNWLIRCHPFTVPAASRWRCHTKLSCYSHTLEKKKLCVRVK